MRTSRSITSERLVPVPTLLPFLGFGLALELGQAEAPETLQEFPQLFQPLRARAVETPRPLAPLAHKTGLLENAQMLRDRRARHLEPRGDLAGGQFAVAEQLEDLASPRLCQRLDGRLHAKHIK